MVANVFTVDSDDRKKTVFTTWNGLLDIYEMPFGLCIAPGTSH